MSAVEEKHSIIDRVFQEFLADDSSMPERWLMVQTLYTGAARRRTLGSLGLPRGTSMLDVGTGFGALAFDASAYPGVVVTAVDTDAKLLGIAEMLYDRICEAGAIGEGSAVRFVKADVYGLPFLDDTFDAAFVRFVYQHLARCDDASCELYRVTNPGGRVCVIDIDDQYAVTYPESSAFQSLQDAFGVLQAARGGDRAIGRKLPFLLKSAGYEILSADVQMASQFGYVPHGDIAQAFAIDRLLQNRGDIVERGIMSAESFDAHLERFAQEVNLWQFNSNAQVVVTGVKPVGRV